jgi:hypothetical protein
VPDPTMHEAFTEARHRIDKLMGAPKLLPLMLVEPTRHSIYIGMELEELGPA